MTPEVQALSEKLASKEWRMENLYLILTEDGAVVPFKFRTEQDQFRQNCHSRNFIAKGRKLGAMKELARITGMNAPQKVEVSADSEVVEMLRGLTGAKE